MRTPLSVLRSLWLPVLPAVVALAVLPGLSGCSSKKEADLSETAYYGVNIVKGCAVELDHPGYDPKLPGYWLVGDGAMIQLNHIKDVTRPDEFHFMLRTKPDASAAKPSEIDVFKILTPSYRIVSRFDAKKTAPVVVLAITEKKEGTEAVPVKVDDTGKFIRFERSGEYVKVTLTAEGMKLIGDLATVTWQELPPGKKGAAGDPALESEAWRRVL